MLLGHRGLQDRQGLAELHRAALELAEHREELLGRAGLQLGGDDLGGPAADPLPEPRGPRARHAEGQAGQPGRADHGTAGEVGHVVIVTRATVGCRHPLGQVRNRSGPGEDQARICSASDSTHHRSRWSGSHPRSRTAMSYTWIDTTIA